MIAAMVCIGVTIEVVLLFAWIASLESELRQVKRENQRLKMRLYEKL